MNNLDWTGLDREVELWQHQGLRLPLWWRDDDAIAVTPQLEKLLSLSEELALPVSLAVIPRDATPGLFSALAGRTTTVLVHGWAHANHAPERQKTAEFGPHRPIKETLAEAQAGLVRLTDLSAGLLRPVFVPPWNRIDPALLPHLPSIGFSAVSTFTPRATPDPAPGLVQINTHLDPIDWRGYRSVVSPDTLIAQVVRDLRDRRQGVTDATEPYGILTHHLVHDEAIWDFTKALIARLTARIAEPWAFTEGDQS